MAPNAKFEAYKVAIEAARHDTDNLWRTFSAFLVSETFLLGFVLNSIGGQNWRPRTLVGSGAGLLLCVAWTATHARATTLRDLRIHQARELEENPSRIIRDGAKLVEGEPVDASGRTFELSGWLFTNAVWLNLLILFFAASDLVVATWAVLSR